MKRQPLSPEVTRVVQLIICAEYALFLVYKAAQKLAVNHLQPGELQGIFDSIRAIRRRYQDVPDSEPLETA